MLGSAAQRSCELSAGTVQRHLAEAAAAIFAEPIPTLRGAVIEWSAPGPGRVEPLSSLTEDERAALRASLAAHVAAITALAGRLAAQATPDAFWLAEALRNALEVPDDTGLWALRDAKGRVQAVVVN